jgi:hypothetical protein
MGRTWRKNSDYSYKKDAKDQQRQLQKRNKKLQKQNKKLGNDEEPWFPRGKNSV